MRCAQFREASSSGRDGEALGAHSSVLERHRLSCAGCASWVVADDAIMRTLRMRSAEPVPDGLAERIISGIVLPGHILRRRIRALRLAVAVLGLVAMALAAAAMAGRSGAPGAGGAARQLGAVYLGIGLGLQVVAAQPRRAGGGLAVLLPVVLAGGIASVAQWPGWASPSAAAGMVLAAAAVTSAALARAHSRFMPPAASLDVARRAGPAERTQAASA